MNLVLAVRLLRYLGWLLLAGSVGVVVVVAIYQAVGGPDADQRVWPTPRLWRYLFTTLWMAGLATVLAMVLALPAAFALIQVRRAWQRRVLGVFVVLPLVTMPSTFAYAWLLLSTSRNEAIASFFRLIGWSTPGLEPVQAAWVLATWLWPIPALILSLAFKQIGVRSYQLACIDASPARAFCRGALPVMRAPIMAAAALVFILAAIDTNVPPLLLANNTWSSEMTAMAAVAGGRLHPVAYLAWSTWPLLAVVALVALAAVPGLRQMARWADEPNPGDTGSLLPGTRWSFPVACAVALLITLLPIVVFILELATGRNTPTQALATAWLTAGDALLATLVVAVLAAVASVMIAMALLVEPNWPRCVRVVSATATAAIVAVAIWPAELTGSAVAVFFLEDWISPRDSWNVYDDSPFVWMAAMIARFAFLPVCLVRLLNRRLPMELTEQAAIDGANRIQRLAHTRLPPLGRPLLAAGVMVGCLTMSEVAASQLLQPPGFFGGSLAVHVDALMHYGRQNETIALALMLMIPAILAACAAPLLVRTPRSTISGRGEPGRPRPGLSAAQRSRLAATRRGARSGTRIVALFAVCGLAMASVVLAGCDDGDSDAANVDAVFGGPGLGFGEFSYPRAIAVSPVDGRVFVVDKSARIQRFSPSGEYEHVWRMPEFENGKPTGLMIDSQNRVWVPDTHYHRVVVFDRDGGELFRFGSRGEGPGQFIFPTAVALDRDGNIYVGEYGDNDRISKFSPTRQYLFSFADKASGDAWVQRPADIVIDESDVLWVTDACHHRICRYDRDGKFLSAFGSPGAGPRNLNYPYGLVLEKGGTVLVADRGNNRIVRLNRNGEFQASWGSPGRAVGQILQPWDLALTKDGRIYCLDSWNNRVQLIDW